MQLSATMCDTKTKEPKQNTLRVLTQAFVVWASGACLPPLPPVSHELELQMLEMLTSSFSPSLPQPLTHRKPPSLT